MFPVKTLHLLVSILCITWMFFAQACISSELRKQIEQSNQRALTANAARDELIIVYRTEGNAAIDRAPTSADARSVLQEIRQRWKPVWGTCDDEQAGPDRRCHDGTWPALRDAQGAWAAILEQQSQGTAPDAAVVQQAGDRLRQAYCALGVSLPTGVNVPPSIQAGCEAKP